MEDVNRETRVQQRTKRPWTREGHVLGQCVRFSGQDLTKIVPGCPLDAIRMSDVRLSIKPSDQTAVYSSSGYKSLEAESSR
ncbi:hypothetical protein J6590_102266 [Homalodisca vitripennis]|nr:hypothetical protein J6590_102266 [Homalodisca vitripennis]